ncbi:MAG: 1-acyl-sn-glycerol-3-phosphate acyltransferase [Syntrophobacterales bacterium]|jgi:1-acyl-sn-glycerol-3-phosphate acyltransferase|nr:1-acyl-sn-glycerol-3-phosphate acyltransferase [Syntrophobacterales bacterium]
MMERQRARHGLGLARDFLLTIIIWTYYIISFFVFFSFLYAFRLVFAKNREFSFQRVNAFFFRTFFRVLAILLPRVSWHIGHDVKAIRSSVIIANHLSFLDPILLVSLFPRQKTIVKSRYFAMPVFGWILKRSGYIPAFTHGEDTDILLEQVAKMRQYLSAGGNLFIFPEGTRSRTGKLGTFDKGAFRIARQCGAPLTILSIKGTGNLYPPDSFLFKTGEDMEISVEVVKTIVPDQENGFESISAMIAEAKSALSDRMNLP